MAKLYFEIEADYQKVIRLREEIEKLEKKMKSLNVHTSSESIKKLENELSNLRREYSRLTSAAAKSGAEIERASFSMGKAFAAIGGVAALKSLASEIISVRGEFQEMETAIETLVGKDMANKLLPQLKEIAKVSPLTLTDLVGAEKMMLGFDIQADKTIGYLKALSDVSMGNSGKFNSLTLAFSQMSAAGRLMGQDLNQMINAGFNPLQQISAKTGKSIATLKDEMSKGAISAEMVQKAFIDATSVGGKFYNMSENASKTINGQISMMEDAWDSALNEMGQKSEGLIMNGIQTTTSLIENYETVGKVLAGLVGTYGVYKTALLANIALEKIQAVQRLASIKGVSAMSIVTSVLTKKVGLLNAVMAINPWVLLATAITGAVAAMWAFGDSSTAAGEAQKRLDKSFIEVDSSLASEIKKLDLLQRQLKETSKGTDEYNKIKKTIIDNYGKYYNGLDKEIEKVGDLSNAYSTLVDNMRSSIGERQFQSFFTTEQENLDKIIKDGIDKAYDTLISKYGKKEGLDLYKQFYDSVITGTSLSPEILKKLEDATFFELNVGENAQDGFVDFTNNVLNLRSEINLAKKASDDVIKSYKEKFNISDDTVASILFGDKKEQSQDSTTNYSTDYKQAEKDWKEAKSTLKKIEQDKSNFTTKQYEDAKKEEESKRLAFKKLGGDVNGHQLKAKQEQAQKEQKLNKELIDMRRSNQQAEIDLMVGGSEKKRRLIELDWQREIDAIKEQKAVWEKEQDGKLTEEQKDELGNRATNATKKREKELQNVASEELNRDRKAWNEYLIQFGNYQQQKLAITEQFNEKWAEAETEGEKKLIEGQLNQELQAIDEKFGYTTTLMADLFEDASDKSVGAIQEIIDKYEALVAFRNGTGEVSREDLISIGISESDLKTLEKGEISIKDITDAIKSLKGELAGKSPFQSFVSDLNKGIDKMRTANGDTKKIGEGISGIGSAVSSFAPALKQFSSNIGNIFGFDDSKVQGAIDAVDGLGQTASGVGQIMSGDVVGGAMSAVQGISQVVTAFEGMFGADYSGYEKMKAEYEELISVWDKIIARKQEYIDIDYGTESVKAAEEVLRLTEKSIEANRLLGKEKLNAGASAGSHSIGVRQRNRMGDAEMAELRSAISQIGGDFDSIANGRMTGLFDLSIEQLKVLQEEAPTFWTKLDGDVQEYLEKIIASGDALEDTKDKMNEALTGISFDGFYDGFVSTLLDMESSSEDFAKNFEAQLQTAILSGLVADKYRDELEKLYGEFASAAETNGKINETEAATLRARYENIVDSAIAEREQLADVFGWDSSSESSSVSSGKGIASMSQDTADELNGRFTALQIAGEETKNQITLLNITASEMKNIQMGIKDVAGGIQDQLASSYLELVAINENTEMSVKYLKEIQSDIAEVKENTKNI